jgi:hypothetical protein
MSIDVAISGERNMIKKEADKIINCKDLTTEIQRMWNVKSDTSDNKGGLSHLKIIRKTPEQRTARARNQETTENSHIGHCTHPAESIN